MRSHISLKKIRRLNDLDSLFFFKAVLFHLYLSVLTIHSLKCSVLKFIQLGPIIVLGLLKCTIQRRAQKYLRNLKTKQHLCCEGSKRPIVESNIIKLVLSFFI